MAAPDLTGNPSAQSGVARDGFELVTREFFLAEAFRVVEQADRGAEVAETSLTRSGKDAGFDLSLETKDQAQKQLYLVEVKHWSEQKPGKNELRKLVRVTARERAARGILISSSGFSPSIYQGFTEAERASVALGG